MHRILKFIVLCFLVIPTVQGESVPMYERFEHGFTVDIEYDNPFMAESIQVDALITAPDGSESTVPCFYDGEQGWKLRTAPTQPGHHRFTITATTPTESRIVSSGQFHASPSDSRGYIRIGSNPRHFAFDNGDSYFPLGQNLGWVYGGASDQWQIYLRECEAAEINWIRIWMCPWGMTELTWMPQNNRYHGMDEYELDNARLLDFIVDEASQRGIHIQWVIHHHGQYSINHNTVWDQNPFNSANGGFLDTPEAFFTDPRAKTHYKNRLRYLVARWGYSPHVMAWEFWNEVDLTHNFDPDGVTAWHEEMIPVLKQLDPTGRLLTTSTSHHDFTIDIDGLDFLQSHAYRTDIIEGQQKTATDLALRAPERPHFFGEMSYDWRGPNREDTTGIILHNQLWSSVHSHDSGTAMTWWWDNWVHPNKLYHHFAHLARYIDGIDWNSTPLLSLDAIIEPRPENTGSLTITPPVGWWESPAAEFSIHADGRIENLPQMSRFIHGQNHRDMVPNPTIHLHTKHDSVFAIQLERAAASGAILEVRVNDKESVRRVFEPSQDDSTIRGNAEIRIPLPPGQHSISLRNPGRDWIAIRHYRVDGVIQRPRAFARGHGDLVLVWVQDRAHQFSVISHHADLPDLQPTTLTLPSIPPGEYTVEQFDPYSGDRTRHGTFLADDKGLAVPLPSFRADTAFRIHRVSAG